MSFIRFALVIAVAFGLTACPRPPEGAPVANFTATPKFGKKPLDVQFTDTSLPGDSAITSWAWDFGDTKAVSTEQNPLHTFTANGVFDVELTVTNAQGSNTTLQTASIVVGNVWADTDGFGADDEGVSVATMSNGDIVTLSQVRLVGDTDTQLQVERRTEDGEFIWSNFFGGDADETPGAIIATSDGDIVFCATTESFGAGNEDAWVVRLDGTGLELWSETYGTFYDDTANDLIEVGNDFVIAGKTTTLTRLADAYLFKIDEDGEEVWSKSYGTTAQETIHGLRAADGGFILAGEQSGLSVQTYVVRADKDGKELWSGAHGGTGADRGYEPFLVGDNYVILGTGYSETITAYDIMILNLDKDGKFVSSKFVGGVGREEGFSAVLSGGNFIVAGSTTTATNGGRDAYLVSLKSDGTRNWSRIFGGTGDEEANAITVAGSDLVMVGSTTTWGEGSKDIYLLRSNSTGYGPQEPTID